MGSGGVGGAPTFNGTYSYPGRLANQELSFREWEVAMTTSASKDFTNGQCPLLITYDASSKASLGTDGDNATAIAKRVTTDGTVICRNKGEVKMATTAGLKPTARDRIALNGAGKARKGAAVGATAAWATGASIDNGARVDPNGIDTTNNYCYVIIPTV